MDTVGFQTVLVSLLLGLHVLCCVAAQGVAMPEYDLTDWLIVPEQEGWNELLGNQSSQNTHSPLDVEQHRKGDEVLLGEACVLN